jgi:hypothetical protein
MLVLGAVLDNLKTVRSLGGVVAPDEDLAVGINRSPFKGRREEKHE